MKKFSIFLLLAAFFMPLAMNAQTRSLKKQVSHAPRPQLQLEAVGQLEKVENYQPGMVYHRAAVNTRDNVLYSNGFETSADLTGLSVWDYNEDDFTWGRYNGIGANGSTYALGNQSYDFDNQTAITPDDFIIMPAITLPTGGQYFAGIYAEAYMANQYYTSETMGIFVAPENDQYIYQVGSDFTLSTGSYEYCEVDLTAYAGQTIEIYIRHYNCSDGTYLFVDDFSVFERVPEDEVTIGSGTNTNAYVPTRTQRRYSLTQQIYTATEIGHTDGGNITSVSFYGSRAATRNLDIYMVNTTQSTISSNTAMHPTTSDRVYSGSVSFTANSWTKITFSTPFEYTGGNVVLIVDDNTGTAANNATNFRVFTANNQAIYIHGAQTNTNTNYNPTSTNLSYTAQNSKNQVKFTIEIPPTPVESITASDISLMEGLSAQIDYTISPADATNQHVTFTSADTDVAYVDANGLVSAVGAGSTTITIAAVDGSNVSTTINVTVSAFVGLIFDFENDPAEEGWTFVDNDGDGFNWTWEDCSETPHMTPLEGDGCLYSLSYDNDNNAALTPDNWAITPAIHILNSPSVVAFYAMGQDADWAAEHVQIYAGLSDDPSSMTAISAEFVTTGDYVQYVVNIPDTYAGQIIYLAIVHHNVTDQFALDVDYVIVTNAELAPEGILVESISADDVEVVVGGTANITNLEVLPADATNPAVTYTSNAETIATVDANGVVTGVGVGTTTITIAATDGSGVTGTINVTVNGIDVTGITAGDDITIMTGETATISYTVAPANATDQSVTFTSANTAIATVDADGVVTGVGVGETTITIASVSNPEVTATITVTVTSNPDAVQFTVNAPANAHPGDVITVEAVLNAPTEGTYTGFTGLVVGLHFDTDAFAVYLDDNNNAVINKGPVADASAFVMPSLPNENHPETVNYSCTMTPGNPNTTTGIVFTVQFTVLTEVELGSYTFYVEPTAANNFVYNPGGTSATPIPYEYVPSTVVISDQEAYVLNIDGYGTNPGGYYLIATPIGEVNPASIMDSTDVTRSMVSGNYDLYYFDDDQEMEWINYKAGTFNLEPGKGYLYANKFDIDLVFSGAANTEDIEITLHKSETNGYMAGWNLVGNPYAETAYLADGRDFYTMNSSGTLIVDSITSNSIQRMEGVFVVADHDGEKIHFTTTEPTRNDKSLVLNLTQGRGIVDRAIIRFGEGRTLPKFQIMRNTTKVYIPVDNQDYAVVRSEEVGEMPVSFKAEENGVYTLSFSAQNTEFGYLHLIDNLTGNEVDLLATPSYSFEGKTTDYTNRFKLVYATGNATEDSFAFFSNGSFVINNEGNATLQVIDINGRILSNETINGCANVNVNAASGVYMLRLVNGDNVKVQKVVVR